MTPTPSPKAPRTPPARLVRLSTDVIACQQFLWRIAKSTGIHPSAWNALREFGPISGMRWDPQDPPPSVQPARAVMYTATDLSTVVAEVFQKYREVFWTDDTPYLHGFTPTRPLQLLDLTGDWLLRNGGSAALASTPFKQTPRSWSAAILDEWPELDGLWMYSTMTNKPVAVLYPNSRDAFPVAPAYSRPLTHPPTERTVKAAARCISYYRA